FDREIEIGVPDRDGRLEILQIHTRGMPLAKDVELEELAGITHGYVGADLSALSKEAAMRSLRRILPEIDIQVDYVPPDVLNRLEVTRDDFLQAYREMEPSTLREVLIERPNVHWDDIGGLDEAKQEMRESIEWPLTMNKLFAHFDARRERRFPGHGARDLADPHGDGRPRGTPQRDRDRGDEPDGPRRHGSPAAGSVRPAHLHRPAGSRDPQGDPRNPHPEEADR